MHTRLGSRANVGGLLIAVIISPLLFAAPASAYVLTGAKWSNGNITATISETYSGNGTAWANAISSWNPTDLNITRPPGNQPIMLSDVSSSSVSWDGYATWSPGTGTINNATGQLNHYYTKNYDAAKRQGVAAHEIGHIVGLAHRSGCYLMNGSTPSRCGIYTPTSDEVAGVNYLY